MSTAAAAAPRLAERRDVPRVVEVLATAFADDPLLAPLLPPGSRRGGDQPPQAGAVPATRVRRPAAAAAAGRRHGVPDVARAGGAQP